MFKILRDSLDIGLIFFEGMCLDASDEYSLMYETQVDSLSTCLAMCLDSRNCVALAFQFERQMCRLYDKGPYTHGFGVRNTKCYIITPGTIFTL